MDQESRRLLIGGSLFLQSNYQGQGTAERYSGTFWFREERYQNSFASYIKRFLDSIALLLVPTQGAEFVTACTLDLPPVDPPAQTFTLRIARNGSFAPIEDQKSKHLATTIIEYIQTGGPLYV